MDLTDEVRPMLEKLDTLIEAEFRGQIDGAISQAREMLARSDEPFGWHFLDLGSTEMPGGVRSGGVFVLPGETAPPAHRHPNSIQHMRVLSGEAEITLASEESGDEARSTVSDANPWIVIPRDLVHSLVVAPDQDLVVLSFHTVPQEELLEVGEAGERTYTSQPE
jgi:oxalate decarboxylase/phosphoglucose isomerase-like protein (cupin superfamily)